MAYNPDIQHRRSIRLKGYDYTQPGMYFVTICAYQRQCIFGDIVDGQMVLNQYGSIVAQTYQWLSQRYHYVYLDEWIIMPNHFHGIIVIIDTPRRGSSRTAPTSTVPIQNISTSSNHVSKPKPLGRLIGAFKTVSTKHINILRDTPATPVWQRNYYEHIIRNQTALDRIREYITNNPISWQIDQLHPNNPSK
ncbi:MAG: transposase [Stanieria sp.]